MRMYDITVKKRDGGTLTPDEIDFWVQGVTDGAISDEQTAAFLMAVYFRGMTPHETAALTMAMARSGDMADLSGIKAVTADKHSTGGVGDKTTLVAAPIVAACGAAVAKMSGKGLGHTGGTVDKLSAIPGFRTEFTSAEFIRIVNETGLCLAGQSGNLAPADKKLYALRDITGTVDSLPLIAASVMSKKLAAGADVILLDVKAGSGAFMKTPEEAESLARAMVEIGKNSGKKVSALITDMSRPLGYAIGNALEVIEAAETLQGRGPEDLYSLCITLSAHMLALAGKGPLETCRVMAEKAVADGSAFRKLTEMAQAQGGDAQALLDYKRLPQASARHTVQAPAEGFIIRMDAARWGVASMVLGAGRSVQNGPIDYAAGVMLRKKTGDYVRAGEAVAELYTNQPSTIAEAESIALDAFVLGADRPEPIPLVYTQVG